MSRERTPHCRRVRRFGTRRRWRSDVESFFMRKGSMFWLIEIDQIGKLCREEGGNKTIQCRHIDVPLKTHGVVSAILNKYCFHLVTNIEEILRISLLTPSYNLHISFLSSKVMILSDLLLQPFAFSFAVYE